MSTYECGSIEKLITMKKTIKLPDFENEIQVEQVIASCSTSLILKVILELSSDDKFFLSHNLDKRNIIGLSEEAEVDKENIDVPNKGAATSSKVKRNKKMVRCAMKIIPFGQTVYGLNVNIIREIEVLKIMQNKPGIVSFYQAGMLEDDKIFILLDYYSTDLEKALAKRSSGFLEVEVRRITREILTGILNLNLAGYVHRDLKPSNILLASDHSRIAVADFGLSRKLLSSDNESINEDADCRCNCRKASRNVVTLPYRAPEIALHGICMSYSGDIWSLGCIIYELLTQTKLFNVKNVKQLVEAQKWTNSNMNTFPILHNTPYSKKVSALSCSNACKVFINECLCYNYAKRPTASVLINHYWLLSNL